jgi:hypothetical protein
MQETQVKLTVDARLLHMAVKFAAVRDVRYYLQGVNVRRAASGYEGGVVIEASDGHTACVIYDANGRSTEDGAIIRADVVKKLPKKGKVNVLADDSLYVGDVDYMDISGNPGLIYRAATIDAAFPIVNRVFPDFTKLNPGIVSSMINQDYLLRGFNFFSEFQGGKNKWNGVRCFQDHENSAILMASAHCNAFVLVMPMRQEAEIERPSWL